MATLHPAMAGKCHDIRRSDGGRIQKFTWMEKLMRWGLLNLMKHVQKDEVCAGHMNNSVCLTHSKMRAGTPNS